MYFVVSIHCFFLPCKPYPPNVAVIVDSPPIFGYNEAILTKEDETMNHTMPDSPARYAVIKRARFLTDVRWTPLAEIPSHKQPDDSRRFPAGVTVTGMPYSSVEVVDKFIGENVSFGTFLSAVANPDSVLYTRDLSSFKNASGYYGCVCNELVRYALGIPQRYNTRHWYEIPGMHKVLEHGAYSADELRLCDILHEYDSIHTHVALVTDLLRDKEGKVVMIEISEAAIPSCKRRTFTLEEYFKLYGTYDICRWDGTESAVMWDPADEVTLFARDAAVNPRPDIAHCYGDGANILSGEEVVISVFTEDPCNAEIYRDGALIEKIFFKGPGKASRTFERRLCAASQRHRSVHPSAGQRSRHPLYRAGRRPHGQGGFRRSRQPACSYGLPGRGRAGRVSGAHRASEPRRACLRRILPPDSGRRAHHQVLLPQRLRSLGKQAYSA